MTPLGLTTTVFGSAEQVGSADGDATIPPGTQGVRVGGSQAFGTTFARVLGINQFTASADATAVSGGLTGGYVMPIVFPVSMTDCDGSGNNVNIDDPWRLSNPDPTKRRRKLEVKTTRPNMEVWSRQSYSLKLPPAPKKPNKDSK